MVLPAGRILNNLHVFFDFSSLKLVFLSIRSSSVALTLGSSQARTRACLIVPPLLPLATAYSLSQLRGLQAASSSFGLISLDRRHQSTSRILSPRVALSVPDLIRRSKFDF